MNRCVEIMIYDDTERVLLDKTSVQRIADIIASSYDYTSLVACMDCRDPTEQVFEAADGQTSEKFYERAKTENFLEIIFEDRCENSEEDGDIEQINYTFWYSQ